MNKLLKVILITLAVLITGSVAVFYYVKNKKKPDLTISELQIVGHSSLNTSSYSVTIKNTGDKSVYLDQVGANSTFGLNLGVVFAQDKIYPDTTELSKIDLRIIKLNRKNLEPGESISDTIVVSKPKILSEGEYVCFIIDPDNMVVEINEENNFTFAAIFSEREKEVLKSREIVPIREYLEQFTFAFPQEIYLVNPPKGKSRLNFGINDKLNTKLIQLENGSLLGPLFASPHAYKKVNDDIIWLAITYGGREDGEEGLSLYVLNIKNSTLSEPYHLASAFAEDGFYNHKDGEFINDSTFQYRHIWNDNSFKDDSAFGKIIIR